MYHGAVDNLSLAIRLQMKIDQLRIALPNEVDKADMLPSTTYDVAELWRQLRGFVDSVANPDLKLLLTTMLDDPAMAVAYREAPAAKQLHHAWLGGLLEHVISLCTLADRVAPHYPLIDRDLLLQMVGIRRGLFAAAPPYQPPPPPDDVASVDAKFKAAA